MAVPILATGFDTRLVPAQVACSYQPSQEQQRSQLDAEKIGSEERNADLFRSRCST